MGCGGTDVSKLPTSDDGRNLVNEAVQRAREHILKVGGRRFLRIQDMRAKIRAASHGLNSDAYLEINDLPLDVRQKLTHSTAVISRATRVSIVTMGEYHPPGKIPEPGHHKLCFYLSGYTPFLDKAKALVELALDGIMKQSLPGPSQPSTSPCEILDSGKSKWVSIGGAAEPPPKKG